MLNQGNIVPKKKLPKVLPKKDGAATPKDRHVEYLEHDEPPMDLPKKKPKLGGPSDGSVSGTQAP